MLFAGEQLTLGTKRLFQVFRQSVANRIHTHCLRNLIGVQFRVRFKPQIAEPRRATFIKIDFSVLSAPAFGQHPVGRELRAGRKRSSYAAAISCKGDCCQHLTESVIVKIYFFKGVTGALCIYPKAIIE